MQVSLRRRQRVAIGEPPFHAYRVDSGCMTVDTVLARGRRQVLLILYPGDIISGSTAPTGADVGLTAVAASVLTRLPADVLDGAENGTVRRGEVFHAQRRMMVRSMLHAAAIGRLTSEERFTALMLEMAHHFGQPTPGGCTFEMPLSRADMADYLALNPDTLSRIVSRLRAQGILHMPSRRRVIVHDMRALSGLCPLAKALAGMRAPAVAPLAGA